MPKNIEMERTWILLKISSTILAKCCGFFYCCYSMDSNVCLLFIYYSLLFKECILQWRLGFSDSFYHISRIGPLISNAHSGK